MTPEQRVQLIEVAARALIAHGEDPDIAVWEAEGVIDSLGISQWVDGGGHTYPDAWSIDAIDSEALAS